MGAELLFGKEREGLGAFWVKLGPVDGAGFKIMQGEADGVWGAFEGILGVFAPEVGRGDEEEGGEGVAACRGEEGIDTDFGDGVFWQEEFALNGAVRTGGAFFGDEVYADIADVAFFGPVVPHPDVGETIGLHGIKLEEAQEEAFEAVAEVSVVARIIAELVEDGGGGGRWGGL